MQGIDALRLCWFWILRYSPILLYQWQDMTITIGKTGRNQQLSQAQTLTRVFLRHFIGLYLLCPDGCRTHRCIGDTLTCSTGPGQVWNPLHPLSRRQGNFLCTPDFHDIWSSQLQLNRGWAQCERKAKKKDSVRYLYHWVGGSHVYNPTWVVPIFDNEFYITFGDRLKISVYTISF